MIQADLPKTHDQNVELLTKNLKAVKRPNLLVYFLVWLIPSALIIAAITMFFGLRPDLAQQIMTTPYLVVSISLGIAAILTGWLAIKIAIPGQEPQKKWRLAILAIPLLLIVFVSLEWMSSHSLKNYISGMSGGYPCMISIVGIALFPMILLSILTSRLAPLHPFWAATLVSLAALFLSAFGVQLRCPIDNACHLALWHYLPIFVASFLIAFPLQYYLGKWKRKTMRP